MKSEVKMAVEARGLVREYRRGAERIRALKGVDVAIAAGEFVGLTGHSGAGKTTFLNLAGLMDRPTEGKLTVLGHDVGKRGAGFDVLRRKNIGFVFQEFYLMPTLTALENVLMPTMWGKARDMTEIGSAISDRVPSGPQRSLLERLGAIAHHLDTRSFLVGGPVRDLILGRASPDLDIAVEEGVISADDPLMEPKFYVSPDVRDWVGDYLSEVCSDNPRWSVSR